MLVSASDWLWLCMIVCGYRFVLLGSSGQFSSIRSNGIELLAAPIQFLVTDTPGGTATALQPAGQGPTITQLGPGVVRWTVVANGVGALVGVSAHTEGTLSYDGFVDFNITLESTGTRTLADVQLIVPMSGDVVKWLMGWNVMPSGRFDATSSPIEFSWQEYGHGQRNGAWLGKPSAGMRVLFKGPEAAWNSPIEMPSHPPGSWANCPKPSEAINCKGNASVSSVNGAVLLQSSTGSIVLSAAEPLAFNFDLLVTPLRPVNLQQHFTTRYYQFGGEFPPPGLNLTMSQAVDQLAAMGVTWVNIHQGSNLNPYINYPLRPDLMADLCGFVELCHARNLSVKLYLLRRILVYQPKDLNQDWSPRFSTLWDKNGWI